MLKLWVYEMGESGTPEPTDKMVGMGVGTTNEECEEAVAGQYDAEKHYTTYTKW